MTLCYYEPNRERGNGTWFVDRQAGPTAYRSPYRTDSTVKKNKPYQNQDARRAGSALTDVRQRGSARAPGHGRRAIAPRKGPLCASRKPARSAACTHQTHRLPPQQQEPACAHNTAAASPSRLLGAQESTRDTITTVQSDGRKHPHDERQQALTPSSPSPASSCLVPFFSAPFHRNQGKRHHRRNRSTRSPPGRQPEASWGTSRGCQAFLSHNVTHCHTEPHVSHNIVQFHR